LGHDSIGDHLHPEILFCGLSSSISRISLHTAEALRECSLLLIVIALATWHTNVFTINALLSSFIAFLAGGSEAVRISLAFEVSDHCFVEFLLCREFVCFSIIFPWHVHFSVLQLCCQQAPDIALITFL